MPPEHVPSVMRAAGIEPAAKSLKGSCSTTELRPRVGAQYTARPTQRKNGSSLARRVDVAAHVFLEELVAALHERLQAAPAQAVPPAGVRPEGHVYSGILH